MSEVSARRVPMPIEQRNPADARDWSNVLATLPLFAGLGRRQLKKVAGIGRLKRFHDLSTIVHAGEPGQSLYVVLDGEVLVRRRGISDLVLSMGSFFGEIALLDGGPRSATVVAKGPVTCLTISQPQFLKLLRAEPAIAVAIVRELAARLRAVQATS
jgi:CRP/FNR family transcriptional regulator, cyclic AMP receptor protein